MPKATISTPSPAQQKKIAPVAGGKSAKKMMKTRGTAAATKGGNRASHGPAVCAEMEKLKAKIYEKCTAKRKVGHWERCAKFVMEPFIDQLITEGRITSKDRFLDIGSSVGNVVLSVASRAGCAAHGVEITKPNHEVAQEALSHFKKHWEEQGMQVPKVDFFNADMCKFLPGREQDYSVVWISNYLFPMELDGFLYHRLRHFAPGTRIFVMKDIVAHDRPDSFRQEEDQKWFTFKDLTWTPGSVEWCSEPGKWYLYTRTEYMGE